MACYLITLASEQRHALYHICEYGSDRPYVDRCAVIFLPEKEFRGSEPTSDNLLCPWLCGQVEDTGKTEVDDLKDLILVKQDV
jgi:hypothetical protein